jgi:hypothetical protein
MDIGSRWAHGICPRAFRYSAPGRAGPGAEARPINSIPLEEESDSGQEKGARPGVQGGGGVMAGRAKTRPPLVPGVSGAITRAAWKPVERARHGQLVRSLRPSRKHLIVPLDAELPRGPRQRLRTRRRIISKAHKIMDDQFRAISLELPALVRATRGLPRQRAVLCALAELMDRHCGPHEFAARGLGAWIQQMLTEIGPEPPAPQRPGYVPRRGLKILDGGRA